MRSGCFLHSLVRKKELSLNQEKRLHMIAVAAMKQSGRLTLPQIILKEPLSKWKPFDRGTVFFGDVDAGVFSARAEVLDKPVTYFIGPERGWDERERSHLKTVLNAKPIRFHHNVLRTDTAAIFLTGLMANSSCLSNEHSFDNTCFL